MLLPKVAILMAIYKPNMQWLEEQLKSINEQTYSNLELIVWNDCPDDANDYDVVLREYITKIPYELHKGEKNLGPTKAFEALTKLTKNREDIKYIAYCDQDDIWLSEKIAILVDLAEKENLDLVCSDMSVIDKDGNLLNNSFLQQQKLGVICNDMVDIDKNGNVAYNPSLEEKSIYQLMQNCTLDNLFEILIQFNFVSGCTILIKREMANEPMPYSSQAYFDQWLAIYVAGTTKRFKFHGVPLIKRRVHDNNFSLSNQGTFKEIYATYIGFMEDVKKYMPKVLENEENKEILDKFILDLRLKYFRFKS